MGEEIVWRTDPGRAEVLNRALHIGDRYRKCSDCPTSWTKHETGLTCRKIQLGGLIIKAGLAEEEAAIILSALSFPQAMPFLVPKGRPPANASANTAQTLLARPTMCSLVQAATELYAKFCIDLRGSGATLAQIVRHYDLSRDYLSLDLEELVQIAIGQSGIGTGILFAMGAALNCIDDGVTPSR